MTGSCLPSAEPSSIRVAPGKARVAVVGAGGMLGRDLVAGLDRHGLAAVGFDHARLDITEPASVWNGLQQAGADLVINCAAYTAVDRAETEPDLAFAVNRDGAAHLAAACDRLGVPLIHISTDYVFDGETDRPYREDDPTCPLGVYGLSKWQGEQAVRGHLNQHLIVRTAWLYGVHGHNFVKTILRLASEREELRVVADQHGCPTWTGDLAAALVSMASSVMANRAGIAWGNYHYCGAGETTWHGFAAAIIQQASRWEDLRVRQVVPISTAEYPLPARRPMCSVLDCGKIAAVFGIRPRPWQVGLTDMLRQLGLKNE